jgi:hypothetical protein
MTKKSDPKTSLTRFAYNPSLTLADIENGLRELGYPQEQIDQVLAFVAEVRERMRVEGKWPPVQQKPS